MLKKLTIDKLGPYLKNKRVLIRVDFNVPIKNGKITDDTRIKESLKTIQYSLDQGASSVVLMSHLGRPNGQKNAKYSLEPIVPALEKLINKKVEFVSDCVGDAVKDKVTKGQNGQIFLLENLRYYAAEEGSREKEDGTKEKEKKDVIENFRKELTSLGDVYVNDAFGTSHRAHSSITGVKLPLRAAGFLLKKELEFFSKVLENPQRPLLVILGGAKVKDKIQLINNMLDKVDKMIITGGMAFTFLKQSQNAQIGKSIFDAEGAKQVEAILNKAKSKNVQLYFPEDFVIVPEIKEGVPTSIVTLKQGIPDDKLGIDVGPNTLKLFSDVIASSKTIFLNGANGVFELNIGRAGSLALVEVNYFLKIYIYSFFRIWLKLLRTAPQLSAEEATLSRLSIWSLEPALPCLIFLLEEAPLSNSSKVKPYLVLNTFLRKVNSEISIN
jgi:phosphoglycerate kinase